jgi:hypothetical protein
MRLVTMVCLLAASSLMAQDPVDARGWLNRGVQEFKSARYPEATAAFQRAVESDPTFVPARLYLATAYMQQYIPGVDTAENRAMAANATEQFLKALDLEPQNTVAMASLGSLNMNQKNWDQAQQWYQKLVAVDPSNAQAWYSMGWIAWARWYPAYGAARASLGMKQQDPGPLPPGAVKEDLKAKYGQVIEGGLQALRQGLLINPQYDDAMAYMNLLIRERADLRDTVAEYQRDLAEADDWVSKAMEAKREKAQQRVAVPLPGGVSVGVTQSMVTAAPPPPPPPPPGGQPQRLRQDGNFLHAHLIRRVPPVYPPEAKTAGIQGVVHLEITIGKDGQVMDVKFVGGPEALAQAAIDAVKL